MEAGRRRGREWEAGEGEEQGEAGSEHAPL